MISGSSSSFTINCGGSSVNVPAAGSGFYTISYLFLSTDGGATWTRKVNIDVRNHPNYWIGSNKIINPYMIEINPLFDDTMYQFVSLGGTQGLLVSNNEGGTWTEVNPNNYHFDSRALRLKPITTSSGVKVFALAGHDGGINMNTNVSTSFSSISAWNSITGRGLQVAQSYRHSSSQTSKNGRMIIFGGQDIGHTIRSGFKTNSWHHQGWVTGDGMDCEADFVDSNYFYCADGQSGGSLKRGLKGTGAIAAWTVNLKPGSSEGTYWVAPVILNPQNNKSTVSGYKSVWKSKGRVNSSSSSNYFQLNPTALTGNRLITNLAMAKTDSNLIFATLISSDNSDPSNPHRRLIKTNNGGSTWSWSGTWWFSFNSDIAIDPNNKNRIVVTISSIEPWTTTARKVMRSDDQGATWYNWTTGLSDIPVNCVTVDPICGDVYVGTDRGVYVRNWSGSSWSKHGCSLPNTIVSDLDIANGRLRASTYGRGLWETSLRICAIEQDPNPNSGGTGRVSQDKTEQITVNALPNPSQGVFNVNIQSNADIQGNIEIVNILGEKILAKPIQIKKGDENIFSMDISAKSTGVYFIRVLSQNQYHVIKVIKD